MGVPLEGVPLEGGGVTPILSPVEEVDFPALLLSFLLSNNGIGRQ